jgi:hypothetical protein
MDTQKGPMLMKKSLLISITLAIAAMGAADLSVLAHRQERLGDYLTDAASRSLNPDLHQADHFRSQDLPRLMEALARQDTAFEVVYEWIYSEVPDSARNFLPGIYPSEMVRLNAAAIIGQWGSAAKPAVPQLARLLKDDMADSNAAVSLGMMGPDGQAAIPALITAVEEQRPFAATALSKMGPAARVARPALMAAAQHGPPWLRRESQVALRKMAENLAAQY